MPHDDTRHLHHNYSATGGDPDALDRTDEVVADCYTNTPLEWLVAHPEE
jgi:hypothetical protein